MHAYDTHPITDSEHKDHALVNPHHRGTTFHKVQKGRPLHAGSRYAEERDMSGGPDVLSRHPDCNLFLCWPPEDNAMAANCLKQFQGEFVLYIGEGLGRTSHSVRPEALNHC